MKKINDFEIVDHGVDHSDYFQGCGVSFTKFDECFTGTGRSLNEALDDALCQITSSGFDLSTNCTLVDECAETDTSDAVAESYKQAGEREPEDTSVYYYASVRIKAAS